MSNVTLDVKQDSDNPSVNDPIMNLPIQTIKQDKVTPLPLQSNFKRFKEITKAQISSRRTQLLPLIHNIPTIKEIINKKAAVNMSSIGEFLKDNCINNQKPKEEKSETPFNPNKFIEIHNRNLNIIKRLTNKNSLWQDPQQMKKEKNETSMDRLNKIKRHFRIDFESESLEKKKVPLTPPPMLNEAYYFYHIIPGNNSETIRKCMKHRHRWREGLTLKDAHLMWSPLSKAIPFKHLDKSTTSLQATNHFEYHKVISNKQNLFNNLMHYCESKNLDIFAYMPMTVYIQYESVNYLRQFSSFQHLFLHIDDFLTKDSKSKYRDYFYLSQFNKAGGGKSLLYIPSTHYAGKNMWLIKAVNLNRGRCIKISNSIEGIENHIKHFYEGVQQTVRESETIEEKEKANYQLPQLKLIKKNLVNNQAQSQSKSPSKINYSLLNLHIDKSKYQSSNVILQKYIEKPLLYQGRKFDIRIWVLLTNKMEVYAFKEGHLKATSVNYSIDSANSYVHLTNYSVQKYNDNFSKFESGNEISFDDFQRELDKNEDRKVSVRTDLFPKICDIIKLTMQSVKDKLNPYERKMCFEIFGYDFLLDIDYNPFLLEINTNPGLEISSPLISYLIPRMIDDSLRLTIDELFQTEYTNKALNEKYNSPFPVKGYSNEENMFLKLCELQTEELKIKKK